MSRQAIKKRTKDQYPVRLVVFLSPDLNDRLDAEVLRRKREARAAGESAFVNKSTVIRLLLEENVA
jgi:hypothetical protein